MTEQQAGHMPWDEFRCSAAAVAEWIVNYHRNVENYPVLSQLKPGDIRQRLPEQAPIQGETFADILADVDRVLLDGITHWQSPNFFAFFPANVSAPSILADFLCAGLGVQGMIWATSPACTELETHVLDWLVDMLGLPSQFRSTGPGGGVIQDTASGAVLCAILAAREQATGGKSNHRGTSGKLVAYASPEAHSSVEKAIRIAGIGDENLRFVKTNAQRSMRADVLEEMIRHDRAAGKIPFFVCATVGTTSSHAVDPLVDIGAISRQHHLWFHVDGAMAGTAALCPEFRHLLDGLETAQSYCFNPHKWMLTNFDCSCFYVADRRPLLTALSILPEYLRNQASESGAVIDYRDWQVPLGRRFRSLKLWFVIRHYGVAGLQAHIRRHVALAQMFAHGVADDPDFELVVPTPLNLVCFRHRKGDGINERLISKLNASGRLYMSHTRLDGIFTLRFCVGQMATEERHVRAAWELIRETARNCVDEEKDTELC